MSELHSPRPSGGHHCQVHAVCRADADGIAAVQAARTRRLERLSAALDHPVLPPSPVEPHRARITLRPDGDGALGFNLPRSHTHHRVTWCGLAHPRILAVMGRLPPMPPDLASLELRTDGTRVVAHARPRKARLASRLGKALGTLDLPVDGVAVAGRTVSGEPTLHLEVAGITHRLSPGTFFQVQLDTHRALVAAVREEVQAADAEAILDLYAGCGNLSLPLARRSEGRARSSTLIESSPSACADARHTAAAHEIAVDIRQGDAGAFQAGDAFFDAAILDPPRAGAPGVLAQLVLTRPKAIVFVCCNPGHLARDLKPALDRGYRIQRVQAFDMFPGTEHLEVLASLKRG